MQFLIGAEAERRLQEYFDRIGSVLGNKKRRGSFAVYAAGLLGDGERKSVEPIAARACPEPNRVDSTHQSLLHFLTDSTWSDRDVRRLAARYVLDAMVKREPIEAWIIGDTGTLKQGTHSVGVQRQYTGSAGKVANSQIAVSLSVTTATEHVPIDFELYLPKSWTEDLDRRREARIPDEVQFQTKTELAMAMIARAIADGVPRGVLLADPFYGRSGELRSCARGLGLEYILGVDADTYVYRLDKHGHRRGSAVSLPNLAQEMAHRFRRITSRDGTKKELWSRFVFKRVLPASSDGTSEHEAVLLVMEWEKGVPQPNKFYFVALDRTHRSDARPGCGRGTSTDSSCAPLASSYDDG